MSPLLRNLLRNDDGELSSPYITIISSSPRTAGTHPQNLDESLFLPSGIQKFKRNVTVLSFSLHSIHGEKKWTTTDTDSGVFGSALIPLCFFLLSHSTGAPKEGQTPRATREKPSLFHFSSRHSQNFHHFFPLGRTGDDGGAPGKSKSGTVLVLFLPLDALVFLILSPQKPEKPMKNRATDDAPPTKRNPRINPT